MRSHSALFLNANVRILSFEIGGRKRVYESKMLLFFQKGNLLS